MEQEARDAEAKRELDYKMHQEDNQTKILVAQINSRAEEQRFSMIQSEEGVTKDQQLKLQQDQL